MPLVRLVALCALLLSGCSPLPSVTAPPTFHADTLVSPQTWSFVDLTLRPSVQQALYARDVMDLFSATALEGGVDLHRLPTPAGRRVDFEQDVLPHLDGEVVVALAGSLVDPVYMLLVHTSDMDATMRLLAEDPPPVFTRDARGALQHDAPGRSDVVAGYKNWVVLTNSRTLRDETLDRIDGKGGPSLATDARYREVVDRLSGDRLGFGYLNVSPMLEEFSGVDGRLFESLRARGRLAYSLAFEPLADPGVQALSIRIEYLPDQAPAAFTASGGDALEAMDRLPRGSMLAFAGSNVDRYADSFAILAEDAQIDEELNTLLSQLAGPYALGIAAPTTQPTEFDFDASLGSFVGGVFIIAKLADEADADQVVAAATSVATSAADEVDDSDTWDSAAVVGDGWLAVDAVPAPSTRDQMSQDQLASEQLYQWLRPGFVRDGTNTFVDLGAIEQAIVAEFLSSDDLAIISPIRAVGIAEQSDDQGASHARVQVLFKGR